MLIVVFFAGRAIGGGGNNVYVTSYSSEPESAVSVTAPVESEDTASVSSKDMTSTPEDMSSSPVEESSTNVGENAAPFLSFTMQSFPSKMTEYYFDSEDIYQTVEFEYDDAGNLSGAHRMIDGEPEEEWIYMYDKAGRLEEFTYYRDDKLFSSCFAKYDSQDNLVEEIHVDSNGEESRRYQYSYDSLNRRTKETVTGETIPDDLYQGETIEYYYDGSTNRVIKVLDSQSDGTVLYSHTVTYDANGNATEIAVSSDCKTNTFRLSYDEMGHPLSSAGDDATAVRYENEYDSLGNTTHQKNYLPDNDDALSFETQYTLMQVQQQGTVKEPTFFDTAIDGTPITCMIPVWQKSQRPQQSLSFLTVYGCL